MCRLAAFPKDFSRKEAIKIIENFELGNTDGFGYTYISEAGQIVTKKWALPFSTVLKKYPREVFSNMPHSGWTLAHVRASSIGVVEKNNSHPFTINNKFSLAHNGTFRNSSIIKLCMPEYKFEGTTDSERCAVLIDKIGLNSFIKETNGAGVFICLKKDGELNIGKTSGELTFVKLQGGKFLIASELDNDNYPKQLEAFKGVYRFNSNGKYISHKEKKSEFTWNKVSDDSELNYVSNKNYYEVDSRLPSVYHGNPAYRPTDVTEYRRMNSHCWNCAE